MPFKIGRLFHIIHVSEDLAPLDAWYDDVFAPRRGIMDGGYSEIEKRDASLIVIGDAIIEPMAASKVEGAELMPVGRFFNRFGRHWHSLAWYVDDVGPLWESMQAQNIRVVTDGGVPLPTRPTDGSLFTHPRDTHTQLEFYPHIMPVDYRFDPDFDALAWLNHPLGLRRLAYTTVVVKDLERATAVFTSGIGGTKIGENSSDLTMTRNVYVAVGDDTVVELAQPLEENSIAGRDLAANGDMCHAVTWQVTDLDQTREYLATKNIKILDSDDTTMLADPADTYNGVMRFTTESIAGDPRD
ncbi:VOC family protein [Jatrophihabitans sp. DSM 45814]